ncbi:MAG: PD40 domain-containing protein [Chloroflexi bacterium]|nr:PD40 domain-containing protein [Chloroflexota bacterium]
MTKHWIATLGFLALLTSGCGPGASSPTPTASTAPTASATVAPATPRVIDQQPLSLGPGVAHLAWSPNAKQLAFMSLGSGYGSLIVAAVDGSNQQVLVKGAAGPTWVYSGPSWSPDGRQIAFAATISGSSGLWTINADGSNPKLLLSTDNGQTFDVADPAWSPDGQRIAFTYVEVQWLEHGHVDTPTIRTVDINGSNQKQVAAGQEPSWSPDGRQIAFTRETQDSQPELWIANSDGSGQRRLAQGMQPAWSPQGRWIAFVRANATPQTQPAQAIWLIDPATGSEGSLTRAQEGSWQEPAWSPDGRQLTVISGDWQASRILSLQLD